MAVDGSSDPDVEQQPPLPTTKTDDQLTPPGAARWWYEYCKAKACSWQAALALFVVLISGSALLVAWGEYWDQVMFAVNLFYCCGGTSMLALMALPDPDHEDGNGAGRRQVLPWAHAVAVQVALWSMVMAVLAILVFILAFYFVLVQSWLPGP